MQQTPNSNPFRVPEGYFETFTPHLLDRMQAEGHMQPREQAQPRPRPTLLRRISHYAAAAILTGIVATTATYLYTNNTAANQNTDSNTEEYLTDEDLNTLFDCEMIGNQQIAYYLTEAY